LEKKNKKWRFRMSSSQREVPPADLSLKFMAWDIKELGKEMKIFNKSFEQKMSELISSLRGLQSSCHNPPPKNSQQIVDDLPF
jgi:hypothetical protein